MNPSSVELYKVFPKKWKGTNKLLEEYYFPKDYSKCKIFKDEELYFVGVVKNSADMELNPFKPHYCSLQILSPDIFLSEGDTLEFVIANKTVKEAISQVISAISDYGFIEGNINIPELDNTIIGAYSTLEKAPYDVLQYLSLISGTRWGTRMISEDITAIDFYSPELMENKGTIDCNKEYFAKNKIENLTYDYSTSDYRNKQIITSNEVFANISNTETIISNGYNSLYNLQQKIGKINSITVNGVNKTFATKNEKEIGLIADFYYEISSNQLETNQIYSAGIEITINYIAMVRGREITYNTSEIQRIREKINRNGTISRYENRNDVASSIELQSVSKSYIKYKGIAELTLNLTSRNDFLILGGKYIFNSPLTDINGNYLVKTKKTRVLQADRFQQIIYEYELSNSFDTENELNYFDNQRAKANGNISQGEYIARNIDIENSANIIFSDLQITEIEELSSENILECTLDSILLK